MSDKQSQTRTRINTARTWVFSGDARGQPGSSVAIVHHVSEGGLVGHVHSVRQGLQRLLVCHGVLVLQLQGWLCEESTLKRD